MSGSGEKPSVEWRNELGRPRSESPHMARRGPARRRPDSCGSVGRPLDIITDDKKKKTGIKNS
jgi:hypothetical protein